MVNEEVALFGPLGLLRRHPADGRVGKVVGCLDVADRSGEQLAWSSPQRHPAPFVGVERSEPRRVAAVRGLQNERSMSGRSARSSTSPPRSPRGVSALTSTGRSTGISAIAAPSVAPAELLV